MWRAEKMNEIILDDILVAAHDIEFAQYDNSPEHTFSHRHIRAMKRIFKTYERNVSLLNHYIYKDQKQESHIRWNRKSLAVVLVLILLAILAALAFYQHRGNIKKLLNGQERKTYVFKKNKVD